MLRTFALLALVLSAAADKPTLRYSPRSDEERPMPVVMMVGPQEGKLAVKVVFDKPPWGEDCKMRCANATFFLDLDNNRETGLQLGKGMAETGADLAVTIQGVREFREVSADTRLRAKVRQFLTSATRVDEGATFLELDHRRDTDRLKAEDTKVFLLIDIAQVDVPAGRRIRVVFHPAGGMPVQGDAPGMLAPVKSHIFPGF